GIGAASSGVYAPCWISTPISVAVRLLPIDQLSSGVVIVMLGPYRSAMIRPLYVTRNAAVIPAGPTAAWTAWRTFAWPTLAGLGPFIGASPIGHGCFFASGSALFTTMGVKCTSVSPILSATQPWLPTCFATRTVPLGIFTETVRWMRSIV